MNSAWACQFAPAPPGNDDRQVSIGGYVYAPLMSEQKQPTVEGTLEHDPAFKEAARRAWEEVDYGDLPQEAGFMVSRDGKMSPVQLGKEIGPKETVGATNFKIPSGGAFAILHTHPRPSRGKPWLQQPTQPDIDVAKNFRLNVFVVSASGLWLAEPDGNLVHVFTNNDWMSKKTTRAVAAAAPQSDSSIIVTTLPSVKLTPQDCIRKLSCVSTIMLVLTPNSCSTRKRSPRQYLDRPKWMRGGSIVRSCRKNFTGIPRVRQIGVQMPLC